MKFNWKAEGARLRKMAKDTEQMRQRLWNSESDGLGWDHALADLSQSIDTNAEFLERQTDLRQKRVAKS